MNKRNIRTTVFALAAAITATFGMAACSTGTDPGETNTERSDIRDEGEMVGEEGDLNSNEAARDSMEQYYENNEEGSAVHAGDGTGDGVDREDVQEEQQ